MLSTFNHNPISIASEKAKLLTFVADQHDQVRLFFYVCLIVSAH